MEENIKHAEAPQASRRMTVGEEFVAWAEQNWNMKQLYENGCINPAVKAQEICPYSEVKRCFIEHIDKMIKFRLGV